MSKFSSIVITPSHDHGCGFDVWVDARFADGLNSDEALGVVASALFGQGKPIYVKSAKDHVTWAKHMDQIDPIEQKALPPSPPEVPTDG